MNKFKMALDFLGWNESTLNEVLIEFAENYMLKIFNKIKEGNVKTLSEKDLTKLCDEFMYMFPKLIK